MKKLEYKDFEIKSVSNSEDNQEMFIEGYCATFGNQDSPQMTWKSEEGYVMAQDTIEKGAFDKTLKERKERIAFCSNHRIDKPIGKIVELKEDESGLFIKVRISDSEEEYKTKIREKIYNEMSIGFQTINATWEAKGDGTWLRKLTEAKLYEVSLVTVARDADSKITDIKSVEILNELIKNEKNEEKKYQLMQVISLLNDEPVRPLETKKPNEVDKDILDFTKIEFINK